MDRNITSQQGIFSNQGAYRMDLLWYLVKNTMGGKKSKFGS
jgi:hypothetical protein